MTAVRASASSSGADLVPFVPRLTLEWLRDDSSASWREVDGTVAFIDIRPGNLAMYFPEANAIVPRRIDAASGTPAFKSIAARIRA